MAERIGWDQALSLARSGAREDPMRLGVLADQVRRARHGNRATFIHNLQINPSNVCVRDCAFCGFAALPGEPGGYSLDEEDILGEIAASGAAEVHIVGGLNREWDFNRSLGLIARIRRAFPQLHIKAFTAVEIDWFACQSEIPVHEVLESLKQAGLDCIPGGGAEIFSERIRKRLFPRKIGADRWLEIHETAHRLGIPSNATLLHGLGETPEERLGHLFRLRELQDRTGGFVSFVPLALQTGAAGGRESTMGPLDDLVMIALSRLVLDNIPHIKAYWPMLGLSTAAVALGWGADDLDGTLGLEKVAHASGADTPRALAAGEMVRLIREAGYEPQERNGSYQWVTRSA